MPRTPKALSTPTKPTREKLARDAKDRPKVDDSPSRVRSPKKSPKKSPTKETPTKKEKSPKKESESTVKSPTKKTPSKYSHPTYEIMIRRAIKEEGSRKGTSYAAIYKFVEANFNVPANYQTHVRNNLKKLIEDETLVHGTTTHRYKLSAKAKAEDKKSTPKKTPKKETPKKERSSRSSKSEDSPKKKKKSSRSSKSEDSPKKKKSPKKERSASPKRTPTKKEKTPDSPSKSTRSATKKASSPKKASTPRGGVKKPETKKTPPKTPRGSTKKASPLSSPMSDKSAESGELKWVWQYYDNGFFNYHPTASDVVEGVYQEYRSSPYTTDVRSVKSGQWSYLVDFREMTQQNVEHESHTKRKIRRVQIPASQVTDLKKKYADDDVGGDSSSD